jgi:hypothetical protein
MKAYVPGVDKFTVPGKTNKAVSPGFKVPVNVPVTTGPFAKL